MKSSPEASNGYGVRCSRYRAWKHRQYIRGMHSPTFVHCVTKIKHPRWNIDNPMEITYFHAQGITTSSFKVLARNSWQKHRPAADREGAQIGDAQ